MKRNPTVKDLIEVLQTMDENLPVCMVESSGDDVEITTFEICRLLENVHYYEEDFDNRRQVLKFGNVVGLY